MKDWKIRQEMYHRLNEDYSDDLNEVDVVYRTEQLEKDITDYINLPPEITGWVYPAKSYVVAICYAYWIAEDFEEDLYDLLNDEELLYGNDPYFVVYREDKITYDNIISKLNGKLPETGVIPHIREYYLKEFLLE